MTQTMLKVLLSSALMLSLLTACQSAGTLGAPDAASSARSVLGTSIVGAQGLEIGDQNRIDRLMARGCAVGVYNDAECNRHRERSEQRRSR